MEVKLELGGDKGSWGTEKRRREWLLVLGHVGVGVGVV